MRYDGLKLWDHWERQWASSRHTNAIGGSFDNQSVLKPETTASGDSKSIDNSPLVIFSIIMSRSFGVWLLCKHAIFTALIPPT